MTPATWYSFIFSLSLWVEPPLQEIKYNRKGKGNEGCKQHIPCVLLTPVSYRENSVQTERRWDAELGWPLHQELLGLEGCGCGRVSSGWWCLGAVDGNGAGAARKCC